MAAALPHVARFVPLQQLSLEQSRSRPPSHSPVALSRAIGVATPSASSAPPVPVAVSSTTRLPPHGASTACLAFAVSRHWKRKRRRRRYQPPCPAQIVHSTQVARTHGRALWWTVTRRAETESLQLSTSGAEQDVTHPVDAIDSASSAGGAQENALERDEFCLAATDVDLLGWAHKRMRDRLPPDLQMESISTVYVDPGPPQRQWKRAQLVSLLRCIQDGKADFVAFPMKDTPLVLPEGLTLAAVLPQRDAREALLLRAGTAASEAVAAAVAARGPGSGSSPVARLADLPTGTVVCARAPRRRLQIEARCPQLVVERPRSAFKRRLRRLCDGAFDACVVAAEGLRRLGFEEGASNCLWMLDVAEVVPAFGQGAVGLFCCEADEATLEFLSAHDDAAARACVESERVLKRISHHDAFAGVALAGYAEFVPQESGDAASGSDDVKRQLRLHCTAALPGAEGGALAFAAERLGVPAVSSSLLKDAPVVAESMVMEIQEELLGQIADSASTPSPTSVGEEEEAVGEDDDEGDGPNAPMQDLGQASIFGNDARMPLEDIDSGGTTPYKGRVCSVVARPDGQYSCAVIDIDCEVPARCYPERSDTSSRLRLGEEVEVYCCWRQQQQLRVVLEPPPRLPRRGSAGRTALADLRPGAGPFRAVVISCTAAGTLVDFNCEVPGFLMSSRSMDRGDDIRVYCYEVDTERGLLKVGTQQLPPHRLATPAHSRTRIEDLQVSGVVSYKGKIQRVTNFGAVVDFNCNVPGKMDARDINIAALDGELIAGLEVTVFVTAVSLEKRTVRVSMFRPRADAEPMDARPSPDRNIPRPPRRSTTPRRR